MNKIICFMLSGLCLLAFIPRGSAADRGPRQEFLFPLFQSNMVFPRDVKAPIWGWTKPGDQVTVAMLGQTATTTADKDGKWFLKLGPFPAGGPTTLSIKSVKHDIILKDILIGDVWLCSGQSNMTMGIRKIKDAEKEIANASNPNLRFFDIMQWHKNKWLSCTPKNIVDAGGSIKRLPNGEWYRLGFSATAYFFGRDLQQALNIPIGLVHTSAPGTEIEPWSSLASLSPITKVEDKALETWTKKVGDPQCENWVKPGFDDSSWKIVNFPNPDIKKSKDKPGIIWLRKKVDLPAGWQGKALRLDTGWFGNVASVWFNGAFIAHVNPYGRCDIPGELVKSGENAIVMRFINQFGGFGFRTNKEKDLYIAPLNSKEQVSLAGPWRYHISLYHSAFKNDPPPNTLVSHTHVATGGGSLYKTRILPLAPFAFKGVVWYQGEANQGKRAAVYDELLTNLIADWRNIFPCQKLPFLIVQLANCKGRNPALCPRIPLLREAQTKVANAVPDVAMAVVADTGEEFDQHPKNKQEVGRRVALKAREHVYGHKLDSSGPVFKELKKDGSRLRLYFEHVGNGLMSPNGNPRGFYIADKNGGFVQAEAVIDGDCVVVFSPQIASPEYVRYGWGSWTPCDLYNKANLPAEPFRTDKKE